MQLNRLWDEEAFLKRAKKPLIKQCDLPPEISQDAVDVCVAAVEKLYSDHEQCAQVGKLLNVFNMFVQTSSQRGGHRSISFVNMQAIKEALEKKYGGPWQVVAGNTFSFEISHAKNMLLLFIGAFRIGILAWKL